MSVFDPQVIKQVGLARPPRSWGIRMDGTGQELENLLKQHIPLQPTGRPYTVIEVGSAGCVTLRSFADIVAETCGARPWSVIGTDLPPGKAWSLDMAEVNRSLSGVPHRILRLDQEPVAAGLDWHRRVTLCLHDDPRTWLRDNLLDGMVDFVFIDGCHGKCAGYDFEALERKIAPGGIVAFHDYGELETGTDLQPHCREFINVRSYVHRLGLATPTPSGTTRKGWRFLGEIKGSRHWNGDGNSAAVVQRTEEPLQHQPELSID